MYSPKSKVSSDAFHTVGALVYVVGRSGGSSNHRQHAVSGEWARDLSELLFKINTLETSRFSQSRREQIRMAK